MKRQLLCDKESIDYVYSTIYFHKVRKIEREQPCTKLNRSCTLMKRQLLCNKESIGHVYSTLYLHKERKSEREQP